MLSRDERMRLKASSEVARIHLENIVSDTFLSDSLSSWMSHIGQQVREVLQTRGKSLDNLQASDSLYASSLPDSAASYNLPVLISAVLRDKPPEEVPLLVEFLLRKVMEEFERRLVIQGTQVKKLRITLKELLSQEDRLISRIKALESLAAGSGEEMKLVASQLQLIKVEKNKIEEEKFMKEEDFKNLMKDRDENRVEVEVLRKELEILKAEAKEQKHRLEFQHKLEQMSQTTIKELSLELEKSEMTVRNTQRALELALGNQKKQRAEVHHTLTKHFPTFEELKSFLHLTRQEALQMKLVWQKEVVALQSQLERVAVAATGYHKVLAENRMLYNEVQDLKGNIRVYCRVRPFSVGQSGIQGIVNFIGENGEIFIRNPSKQGKGSCKVFKFNKVYGASISQEEVFQDTRPLIRSVLDGYNVCIFAYGQTGSGKTYTMSGPTTITEEFWGVNYRALKDLFQICQSRSDVFSYEVGVQMIEIYNEQVRDLLSQDSVHKRLEIRNNSQLNGLNVPDASMMPVKSTDDVLELMRIGLKNRSVGATALNERSSRSHSVLTVHVQGMDTASSCVLRGCLHLVDLAGSERVDKSEAVGERLREAQHINKSLSALGDVISALSQKSAHIPYRNSKLTQLLQESLGGQAKTLMFVHISQDSDSYGETISTLKFAERVASVELGAARMNRESGEFRDLKEQLIFLQEVLAKKEEDITKRDVEIERLHSSKSGRSSSTEHSLGPDKPIIKAVKSIPDAKRPEVQKRRNNSEMVTGRHTGHTAASRVRRTLSFIEQTAQDRVAYLSDEGSPKLPSTSCLAIECVTDKVGTSKTSHSRSVSSDSDSQSSAKGTFVSLDQTKQKVHSLMLDREANRKDWSDRIQTNPDMFFASSSPDGDCKYSDDDNVLKFDDDSHDPLADVSTPMHRPSDSWNTHNHSSYPSGLSDFSLFVPSVHLAAENLRRGSPITLGDNEIQTSKNIARLDRSLSSHYPDTKVLESHADLEDTLSEISEGEFPVDAETGIATDNVGGQLLPRKPNIRERSQLQTQIPRPPSRHERQYSDGGMPHAPSLRRH